MDAHRFLSTDYAAAATTSTSNQCDMDIVTKGVDIHRSHCSEISIASSSSSSYSPSNLTVYLWDTFKLLRKKHFINFILVENLT